MRTYGRVKKPDGTTEWVTVQTGVSFEFKSVSQYIFAQGNGSTTSFSLGIGDNFSVSSIYRTDWQGRQLLYATARTNLLRYSDDFSKGVWTSSTTVAQSSTDLLGLVSWVITSIGASDNTGQIVTTGTGQYVASAIFKAGTQNTVELRLGQSGNYSTCVFDLAAGTAGSVVGGGTATTVASGIKDLGGGVYRCWVTGANIGTGTTANLAIWPGTNSSGTGSIIVTAAQVEAGAVPTSYIPTTTAPVTITDYTINGNIVNLGQTPSKGSYLDWTGSYTAYTASNTDDNDNVYLTTLAQVLKLNLGESPFFANYGIPQYQTVVSQVFPDFYVSQTQSQFAPYFSSLVISRVQATDPPQYNVKAVAHSGAQLNKTIPQ